MKFISLIFALATALLVNGQTTTPGHLGDARVVSTSPVGVLYTAQLPRTKNFAPENDLGSAKGSISATAAPNGVGVQFNVSIFNLPATGGPFLYHLHVAPVPTDGNCTKTLAHLDPFIRGETPACDSSSPETCQVGDLSGKHGKITSDPFYASYVDPYASTEEGIGSFFGNRSFVVHFANATRIACANFSQIAGTSSNTTQAGNSSAGTNATRPSKPSSTPYQPSNIAGMIMVPMVPLLAVTAFVAFL
ncbi:superoxide dismutase [Calycina marina]|uniref:superoxide dismutase n=1 Tax=Calycina marina TaxID=1763456 RepID=A0A9P7Z606_9HELO|nr:superoxide dismutase [Calycina marina]